MSWSDKLFGASGADLTPIAPDHSHVVDASAYYGLGTLQVEPRTLTQHSLVDLGALAPDKPIEFWSAVIAVIAGPAGDAMRTSMGADMCEQLRAMAEARVTAEVMRRLHEAENDRRTKDYAMLAQAKAQMAYAAQDLRAESIIKMYSDNSKIKGV